MTDVEEQRVNNDRTHTKADRHPGTTSAREQLQVGIGGPLVVRQKADFEYSYRAVAELSRRAGDARPHALA